MKYNIILNNYTCHGSLLFMHSIFLVTKYAFKFITASIYSSFQNTVIPQLVQFFESTLKVRPLPGPLLFDRFVKFEKTTDRRLQTIIIICDLSTFRDCTDSFMIIFPNEDDRHCFVTCEATTMCNTAEIPSDHLKVIYIVQQAAINCFHSFICCSVAGNVIVTTF